MSLPESNTQSKGTRFWHLGLAIIAVAVVLRLTLGAMPDASSHQSTTQAQRTADTSAQTNLDSLDLAAVEILPINLQGEVPGPLLTSILQRYLPDSTPDHADALRDTLPPSADPRMIVIIPEDDDNAMF